VWWVYDGAECVWAGETWDWCESVVSVRSTGTIVVVCDSRGSHLSGPQLSDLVRVAQSCSDAFSLSLYTHLIKGVL
jgi:hypothetical protein